MTIGKTRPRGRQRNRRVPGGFQCESLNSPIGDYWARMAWQMAARWAGVVPQQPPMMRTPDSSRRKAAFRRLRFTIRR